MEEEKTSPRVLYKSRHDRMIDGVCGGVAEYFGIHSTLIRLLWVCFVFAGGAGVIAYIAAMILLSANPDQVKADLPSGELTKLSSVHQSLFWGTLLVIFGTVLFLDQIDVIGFHYFWHHMPWDFVWPGVLIITGVILVVRGLRKNPIEIVLKPIGDFSHYRRRSSNRKIWGVCSGLADMVSLDVNAIRILWVVLTFVAFPVGLFLYLVVGVLTIDEYGNKIVGGHAAGKQS